MRNYPALEIFFSRDKLRTYLNDRGLSREEVDEIVESTMEFVRINDHSVEKHIYRMICSFEFSAEEEDDKSSFPETKVGVSVSL